MKTYLHMSPMLTQVCPLEPLELIYSHCLIRLNISSENKDLGFHSLKKSTFQNISHLNALGRKFEINVK